MDDISQSYGGGINHGGGGINNPYRMPGENRSLSSNRTNNGQIKVTRKVPYGVSNTLLVSPKLDFIPIGVANQQWKLAASNEPELG